VTGKAPVATLNGVLTGRMPRPPARLPEGGVTGRAEYSTVLTPKGRVVAELRAMWGPDAQEESLWLDVPSAALGPLLAHLRRYVPPRLATVDDVLDSVGLLTIMGPKAAAMLSDLVLASADGGSTLESLDEGEYLTNEAEGDRIVATRAVDTPAWDVFTSKERSRELWMQLLDRGVTPVGAGVWDILRVEAGRPAFGQDMDESVILSEVGIVDRAVDHSKGCYTGQEVIVRIRDRGHVNKLLRGLHMADGPAPPLHAELYREADVVGRVTSAADSPRSGGIALGYVRHEVPEGAVVSVGSVDGPAATVRTLVPGWART